MGAKQTAVVFALLGRVAVGTSSQDPMEAVWPDPTVGIAAMTGAPPSGSIAGWQKVSAGCPGSIKAAKGLNPSDVQLAQLRVHKGYTDSIVSFLTDTCDFVNAAVKFHIDKGSFEGFVESESYKRTQAKVDKSWHAMFGQLIEVCRRNKVFPDLVHWWDVFDKENRTPDDTLRTRAFADMQALRKLVKLPPMFF